MRVQSFCFDYRVFKAVSSNDGRIVRIDKRLMVEIMSYIRYRTEKVKEAIC